MAVTLGELEIQILADTLGLQRAEDDVRRTGRSMERTFSRVGKVIAGALTVEAARRSVMIADNMRRLEGVVKRLTKTTGDFNQVWDELNKVSDANGVAINDSIALFQRFQMSLKNVTDQNGEVIDFIDTLQKIGRIGGSSSQEMSNALTQLSQGLSGGVIRAEEWNSIIDQAPEILNVAAKNIDGVNGDLGILRKKMLDGKLTAEIFYKAISKGAKDVDKEFKELPKTIDQSLTAVENSFSRLLQTIDKSTGETTSLFAKMLENMAGNIEGLSTELDILFNRKTENAIAEQLADLNDEIVKQSKLVNKLKTDGVGFFDALLGDTDIKYEERRLKEFRSEYNKLQKQLQDLRVGVTDDEFIGPMIGKKRLAERNKPKKAESSVINVDEEIKRLDLLADVYDNRFAEIEADMLRKRQEAIKLYGADSQEFLRIDEQLNAKRIKLRAEAEAEILAKANESKQEQLDIEIDALEKAAKANEKLAEDAAKAQIRAAEETARAFEALNNNIGNQLGSALTKTQSFSDAFKNILSDLAGQLISAGITSAFGGAVGGGNVFAGLFGSAVGPTAGGNAFGGGVSPIASHRINERGEPEILEQAGKTYLTANGKGGKITPLDKLGGGGGGGQPNISLINMGTPMNIESSNITEDGIELMINDKLRSYDKSLTAEMSKTNSSKGRAIKSAWRVENNMRR